jgi:hypothetical protein
VTGAAADQETPPASVTGAAADQETPPASVTGAAADQETPPASVTDAAAITWRKVASFQRGSRRARAEARMNRSAKQPGQDG